MIRLIRTILIFLLMLAAIWFVIAWRGQQRLKAEMKNFEAHKPEFYAPKIANDKRQNMAVWIKAGTITVVLSDKDLSAVSDARYKDYSEWNSDQRARFSELLKENELSFRIASRATTATISNLGLSYEDGWTMHLPDSPNLKNLLDFSKLLSCKWKQELADGQIADAIATAQLQARVAAMLKHEPVVIMLICGQVAERDLHQFLFTAMGKINQQQMLTLESEINLMRSMSVPLSKIFEVEGVFFLRSFRKGPIDNVFWESELDEWEERRMLLWSKFNRSGWLAEGLHLYAFLSQQAKQPSAGNLMDLSNNMMARALQPHYQYLIRRVQITDAATLLATAALGLMKESASTGAYPDQIQLPVSPFTGETAIYKKLPDGGAMLAFPESEKIFKEKHGKNWMGLPPRLSWNLPPP